MTTATPRTRFLLGALLSAAAMVAPISAAHAQETIGTTFPSGFRVPEDAALHKPVIGFGSSDGRVRRVPVIFLHGNNDTPYPNPCNQAFGHMRDFAQYFLDHGYSPKELWGLGYQGDQCDLVTTPTNKSGAAHTTVANVADLRAFVAAVRRYTGARRVDIIGHSLGATLAREWMRADNAYRMVRRVVSVDGPHHGIINCSPGPGNYFSVSANGGFTPDSPICREYGSDRTPFLRRLNAGGETPGPTRYLALRNDDTSFVYIARQDGVFPAAPAQDRDGHPHDFSRSASLAGARLMNFTGQGRYDSALQTSHVGICNSPDAWRAAHRFLAATR